MEDISNPNVKIGIQTEEDKALPTASVFERVIAFLTDIMLWMTVSTTLYRLFNLTNSTAYAVLSLILFLLYITVCNTGKLQTLGKFLLGIKVINRKTKGNITFAQSFLRAIGYLVSVATFFIGFAFVFFSKKHLALEDLIAGTEVITIRKKTNAEMTLISFLGTLSIIAACYVIYNNLVFNPYRAMKKSAEEQLVKIAYLEEIHKKRYGTYTNDLLRLALLSGDAVQFQRDMQEYFRPSGFRIAVSKDGYLIEGFAKDNADPAKSSLVHFAK